jgi:hypothetical protein
MPNNFCNYINKIEISRDKLLPFGNISSPPLLPFGNMTYVNAHAGIQNNNAGRRLTQKVLSRCQKHMTQAGSAGNLI